MKVGSKAAGWTTRFHRTRSIVLLSPIVLIAAFHAVILLRRVGDASITRPMVLAQWAFAAVLLIAALVARRALARSGGRRLAILFWLLVAILHLAPAGERYFNTREDVALLVEAGVVSVPVIVVLALGKRSDITAPAEWGWTALAILAFAPFTPAACCGDRAPPRF